MKNRGTILHAVMAVVFAASACALASAFAGSFAGAQTPLRELETVYEMKRRAAEFWPGFGDEKYDVPMLYYADNQCFTVNPTAQFLSLHDAESVLENEAIKVYRTALLDDEFHLAVSVTFGDREPDDFTWRSPWVKASGFEIVRRTIPDVKTVSEWAVMVIHEYFHGFQLKHPAFLDRFENAALNLPPQSKLKALYVENEWFREAVDRENELLLSCLQSGDYATAREFFEVRNRRRKRCREELNFDPTELEQVFETAEGTARWMESRLYEAPAEEPAKEPAEWLWRTDRTTWFYATGYNLARILEKTYPEFKAEIFDKTDGSLEQILKAKYEDF